MDCDQTGSDDNKFSRKLNGAPDPTAAQPNNDRPSDGCSTTEQPRFQLQLTSTFRQPTHHSARPSTRVAAANVFQDEAQDDDPSLPVPSDSHSSGRGLVLAAPAKRPHTLTTQPTPSDDLPSSHDGVTEDRGYLDHDPIARLARARKVPALVERKKVVNDMARWTSRHEELRDPDSPIPSTVNSFSSRTWGASTQRPSHQENSMEATPPTSSAPLPPPSTSNAHHHLPPPSTETEPEQTRKRSHDQSNAEDTFRDEDPGVSYDFCLYDPVIACMLCNRGFKQGHTLDRHVRESALHHSNLNSLEARLVGHQAKLARLSFATSCHAATSQSAPLEHVEQPKYRDRASERRAVFGSSANESHRARRIEKEAKEREGGKHVRNYGPSFQSTFAATQRSLAPTPELTTSNNKGAQLLSLMGWSPGDPFGQRTSTMGKIEQPTKQDTKKPWDVPLQEGRRGLGAQRGDDQLDWCSTPENRTDGAPVIQGSGQEQQGMER